MKLILIDRLLGAFVRLHEKNGFAAVKMLGCFVLGVAIFLTFGFNAIGLSAVIGDPVLLGWFVFGTFLLFRFWQLTKEKE